VDALVVDALVADALVADALIVDALVVDALVVHAFTFRRVHRTSGANASTKIEFNGLKRLCEKANQRKEQAIPAKLL